MNNIEVDKTQGKPTKFVATYSGYIEFNIEELDINWDEVEKVYCKYTTLELIMKDGSTITIWDYGECEIDYKWPNQLQLVDEDYNQLWEE